MRVTRLDDGRMADVSVYACVCGNTWAASYITECSVLHGEVYALKKEGREHMTVERSLRRLATTTIGDDLAMFLAIVVVAIRLLQ